jgi:ketosteroid isomerase-like protein
MALDPKLRVMSEENVAVARHWMETYRDGDVEGLLACLADEWLLHEEDGSTTSRDVIAEITRAHAHAFAEKTLEYRHEVAMGKCVAHHVGFVLVHTGRYHDLEPTGARVELSEMVFHRFEAGCIAESWRMTFPDGIYKALAAG